MGLSKVAGDLGDHVRDAVVITEAEPVDIPGPRMVWVNRAFTEMTGYTPMEAIGQTPRILQGPDTCPDTRARIRDNLKNWRPIRETLKNYTKDGEPFWVELDIKPIADEGGWCHYWVAVQRDVTQHVADADALRQARASADAANRLKSEFLANMSHEIRTPLNAVLGMAQVLKLTELDARQRNAVETIIGSGQSLLGLIEDVLDLSRIEAGQLKLEPLPTTPRSLIEAAAEAVRGVSVQKGLTVELHPGHGSDTPCLLDPRRMRQVLINLAGNATKFTETGKVVLTSQITRNKLVFEVRDTGPGVPEDQYEIIFDRFRQGDSSYTRAHGETGLGLAIVKDLVGAAGGRIDVGRASEGGAQFTVTLPAVEAEGARPAVETAIEEVPAPSRRKVLVIEDNAINREVVAEAMTLNGWDVDTAEQAEPGLEHWRDNTYDLIIMDRQMPGMSGEEAVAQIRAEEKEADRRKTPILMLTAHALVGAAQSARDAGVDAYVTKPFDLDRLLAVSAKLTNQKSIDTAQ